MDEKTRAILRKKLNTALDEERKLQELKPELAGTLKQGEKEQTAIEKLDAAFRTPETAVLLYNFLVESGQIPPEKQLPPEKVSEFFGVSE